MTRWKWTTKLGRGDYRGGALDSCHTALTRLGLDRWKESREQYDDRVVEVVWDKHRQTWKMLRFRDDKHEGNFKTVVSSIIKSIEHGVEADEVSTRVI